MSSIYELSTYNDADYWYISTNSLKYIQDEGQIHPDINARDARLKICDHNKQTQNEWKVA